MQNIRHTTWSEFTPNLRTIMLTVKEHKTICMYIV